MPTPLVPSGVAPWTDPINTPDDGEGATGAGLDGFAQPLANRTELLKSTVDVVGPKRFRKVADKTALKAVTGMDDDDMRLVEELGLYKYDAASAVAEDSPWIIAPNVGPGRWFHQSMGLLEGVHGNELATVNGTTGKVVEPVPFRIASAGGGVLHPQAGDSIGQVVGSSTTSTSYVDVTGFTTNCSVNAGDILHVTCTGYIGNGGAADAFAKLVKVDGGVETDISCCWQYCTGGESKYFAWNQEVAASNTGTLTLKVKYKTSSASIPCWVEKPAYINWWPVRP